MEHVGHVVLHNFDSTIIQQVAKVLWEKWETSSMIREMRSCVKWLLIQRMSSEGLAWGDLKVKKIKQGLKQNGRKLFWAAQLIPSDCVLFLRVKKGLKEQKDKQDNEVSHCFSFHFYSDRGS